jgi:N-Acetylglucosaminyltransferase-IV (GnT-IV) conserved region
MTPISSSFGLKNSHLQFKTAVQVGTRHYLTYLLKQAKIALKWELCSTFKHLIGIVIVMLLRLLSSTRFSGLLVFAALYLVAASYLYHYSSCDPTSLFFNPRRAYTPAYSTVRLQEAKAFVLAAANAPKLPIAKPAHALHHKTLCAGIPSVARKGAEYLQTAVGSLLEGLTAEERDDIHLIVFISHTDPTVHPAYSESWLSTLTDEVLVYNLPQDQMEHIAQLEKEAGLFREKGLFDYSQVLRACYLQETPYIVMFEDDVIAMDGWYHRTVAALKQAETLSALKKASSDCKQEHHFLNS